MRTNLLCSLILCLGAAAGACGQAIEPDQSDSAATAAPTVQLDLTGLT